MDFAKAAPKLGTPPRASVSEPVDKAAAETLSVEALEAACQRVFDDDLYWFGVRHHSPAVARHVQSAILARKPRIVFIEGPAEANHLIPHLVDRETRPPVAIYSSYRDDDNALGLAGVASPSPDLPAHFASWYPMLDYSPELVAIRAAYKVGAEVVFMDLPHHALIRPFEQPGCLDAEADGGEGEERSSADAEADHAIVPETEQIMARSSFYQHLADAAGYRHWDEAWDTLFELGSGADYEAYRRKLAQFCAGCRMTTESAAIASDGTLERERHMLRTIQTTLNERATARTDAFVVCGGFHLFLDADDPEPPPTPPPGTLYTSIVPYSFLRVSDLSGYGAGNRAPQFYQRAWAHAKEEDGAANLLVEHTRRILARARRLGDALSSADAISTAQHARMLARLRGREEPVLDDIHDAVLTCCCKGDPAEVGTNLRRAMAEVDIGTRVGHATSKVGQLPIVADFHRQADELELREFLDKDVSHDVVLDTREVLDHRRAVFFARLRFLDVQLAEQRQGKQVSSGLAQAAIFKEVWRVRWSPSVEAKLVERAAFGESLEAASMVRLREDMASHGREAAQLARRVLDALDMDLPGMIQAVFAACGAAIDEDPRFDSLANAMSHLLVLDRYSEVRGRTRDDVEELVQRAFARACFAVGHVASAPAEEVGGIVDGLRKMAEPVLAGREPALDETLFVDSVREASQAATVPYLRGVFDGLLVETRAVPPDALAQSIRAYAFAATEEMIRAGDYLAGVMAVSKASLLLGADPLIDALEELLKAAPADPFLTMAPRLRSAFESMQGPQLYQFCERVALRHGLRDAESLDLGTSAEAASEIVRIDERVARIMSEWGMT